MKFYRKPVVVDAIQVTMPTFLQLPEGMTTVAPGDWIVTDAAGQGRPVRDDIFHQIYESAVGASSFEIDVTGIVTQAS